MQPPTKQTLEYVYVLKPIYVDLVFYVPFNIVYKPYCDNWRVLSGHMTFIQRRLNVDATSWSTVHLWAEFRLQRDSNSKLRDPKSGELITRTLLSYLEVTVWYQTMQMASIRVGFMQKAKINSEKGFSK